METLEGTVLPSLRFGWYYRPSTHVYEFWWMGETALITVAAEMIPTMPKGLVDEIMMASAMKAVLDS